ncbi:hypothetical protein HCU74_11225 [Spongiibacter sp. KMU-166]|uniref:Uncharacterized protein n=2 Tax=Spongiibacter thalassae TaxID=2721624 RepID=A0ABX1GFI6_9GAMM|nr:hypothetical protein [Spongiibacter thalassae]
MNINIDHLDADELMALNQRIIERLKMLESLHAHQSMMQFHPGSRVSFDTPQGERALATVMKFNRKTVTVVTDSGERWNVSPHLLSAIKDTAKSSVIDGRIEND